jgi:hypothetical protein
VKASAADLLLVTSPLISPVSTCFSARGFLPAIFGKKQFTKPAPMG